MKLRSKFVIYLLLIACIPLSLAVTVALWQSTDQTREMTLDIVQGHLDAGAENLSGYFESRRAEISAYANSPLLKSMNFEKIGPQLKSELKRHEGIYEKFILGTPQGHFYNTAGGNPGQKGLRTFNDKDPNAKPKTIAERDYWKNTVGNNEEHENRTFVSDPMISYTTGAKQIVVAASIKSKEQNVVGMIGGALPWDAFQTRINNIFNNVIKDQEWNSRYFLVTSNGVYWYHWDPAYVVHLERDSAGQVKLNEIGEKAASVRNILNEPVAEVALAGREMVAGNSGYTLYKDPNTNEEFFLVYAPIKSANYSVGLVVPKSQMMSSVSDLQLLFIIILLCAALAVITAAWILSKRIVEPITSLNKFVLATIDGNSKTTLTPRGNDEVTQLTHSFNNLIDSVNQRETSIKELTADLEQRVARRTEELEKTNHKIKDIEVRQRAILESVVDSLITIDEKGQIESANPATEKMFGYSLSELQGRNVSMLMPEPYSSEHDDYLNNYLTTGQAKVIGIGRELFAQRKDKSVFPIELSLSEMVVGDVKKFAGIVRDISQRKESEEALLRDSLALKRLNEIAANPNDNFAKKLHKLIKLGLETFKLDLGIISRIVDGEYTVEYIIGPDGAPPTGTKFEFDHTYCAHTYAANGPVAFDHAGTSSIRNHPCYENFKLESYIGAPIVVNGERYGTLNFSSVEIHQHPFSSNELTLIQLLAQWIGNELSRTRSEQELGRFKTTLDLTMDCVFMFEPDTLSFFYFNQGAMNQIGYSYKELINMKPYEIKPEFSEAEFKEMIKPMLSGEKSAVNFETIHQHKNGKQIPVEIFLQYINPPGEQPRFVAIVRDITERKLQTQQLNDTLEEMTLRTREITLLSSLSDLLHSCQDLNEAYEVVARFMPMLIPQLSGALYLTKAPGENFEQVSTWGDEPPSESEFPTDDCVAVRRGLSYLTKANKSALYCKHLPSQRPELSLCMPLSAQGETFGLLHLQSKNEINDIVSDEGGFIDSLKQEFTATVAKQVSMALASLRLKDQLRDQSIRDPLTGLFNRRYMEETFEREIDRASRNNIALSFVMIDIDHFKSINDTYGHEAGDQVLIELGKILSHVTRNEDIACRYGGEEFVICLPGANIAVAVARAETIRKKMASTKFRHDGKTIGKITVSLGVSEYPQHGDDAAELVKAADKALYQAKNSGRNQVVATSTQPKHANSPKSVKTKKLG